MARICLKGGLVADGGTRSVFRGLRTRMCI